MHLYRARLTYLESRHTKGPSINDVTHFLKFWRLPPLVTHFTKWAYGVTSPFGRSPIHLSGWCHLWMAPKEEGKCLSASEHHRITPSYTDSTSELPLLSFVFSSIFFLSFKVSYTHWKAILFGLCWQEDFFNQNVAKLFCNNVPAAATNIFQKRMMASQVESFIDKRVMLTQEFIPKKNFNICNWSLGNNGNTCLIFCF